MLSRYRQSSRQRFDAREWKRARTERAYLERCGGNRKARGCFEIPAAQKSVNKSGREGRARAATIHDFDARRADANRLRARRGETAIAGERNERGGDPGVEQFARDCARVAPALRGVGRRLADRCERRVTREQFGIAMPVFEIEKDRDVAIARRAHRA